MNKKKWITYGVTGIVGLGLIAGGAAAAAQSMDLRTIDDQRISNGTLDGTLSTDQPVVDDPTPTAGPSATTAVTPPSTVSPPSPVSVHSAASN
jgi:cell division septation protein DedD